jgi:hypothetical protein
MKQYSEGKLRTYTTFKVHFGCANYLSVIGNFEHRRCLTKLRISAHRLHIETGRYQGIPPHQRLLTSKHFLEDLIVENCYMIEILF